MTNIVSWPSLTRRFLSMDALRHLLVFFITLCWMLPLLGLFVNSFRTTGAARLTSWWTVVSKPAFTLENYPDAFERMGGIQAIAYTTLLTLPSMLITVSVSAVGAFALSRLRFCGRIFVTLLLIALLVVPVQMTIVPLLKLFQFINIQGTLPTVWITLAGLAVPYGILLIRGFMAAYPEEIVEAARMDGASDYLIFRKIILPDSFVILASLGILQFVWSWNALLEPLIFLGPASEMSSITVRLVALHSSMGLGIATMTAGTFISMIVPLVVLVGLQRYFVAGITSSGVK